MPHRLRTLWRVLDQGNLTLTILTLRTDFPLHFPSSTMISHGHSKSSCTLSLRVTLIFDCICCIRGWPACHTRFDRSICQLLRCIFSVSHYLTETYLIGSMKVLMGLHRKFLKTNLVNEEIHSFPSPGNLSFKCLLPPSLFALLLCSSLCLLSLSLPFSLFCSQVCKISRGLQHWGGETCLQEGVHHPSAQEAHHPPAVGSLWGAARWVTPTCTWGKKPNNTEA